MHQGPAQTGFKGDAQINFTPHFLRQAATKGFTAGQIKSALRHPEKVTEVTRYPGQLRYCGAGVAVVMDGNSAVTCYLDGVRTPLRADQRDDPMALTSTRVNSLR